MNSYNFKIDINGSGVCWSTPLHITISNLFFIIKLCKSDLINKRFFDEDKHDSDRYLLYVACSRAIENMFIFCQNYRV